MNRYNKQKTLCLGLFRAVLRLAFPVLLWIAFGTTFAQAAPFAI
jgi:hypothetical protein